MLGFHLAADVSLYPDGDAHVYCGELTSIVCYATDTNAVTIIAQNDSYTFGRHTYERGSPRAAKAGPLDLNLIDVVVSDKNPLLTNFNVSARKNYTGEVTKITCNDVSMSSKHVIFQANSKYIISISLIEGIFYTGTHCANSNIRQDNLGNSTVLLQWDNPNCTGWREVSHFTLLVTEGEEEKTVTAREPLAIVSSRFSKIAITVTNLCKETSSVGELENKRSGKYTLNVFLKHSHLFCY